MLIENITIPDLWCERLADLQKTCPTAIIAGGAIRDLYLGRTPKDVDFFTAGDRLPTWPGGPNESGMDYKGMQYVKAVAEYKAEIPYQVIITEQVSPIDLLASFDIGLCQIGFDGKALIKTEAFLWDVKHSVMTMRHTDRYSRSIRRYARINERYNMDLIIPQLETFNANPS